jgi:hypothetical protein
VTDLGLCRGEALRLVIRCRFPHAPQTLTALVWLGVAQGTKVSSTTFPSQRKSDVKDAGLALAGTTITREPSTGGSVVTNPSSSLSTSHWLVSDVYKASVYDPSEHKIGDISDLIIDSNGKVTAAIISVGQNDGRRSHIGLPGAVQSGRKVLWMQ